MENSVKFEFVQLTFMDRNFNMTSSNVAYRVSDGYEEAFDCRKSKEELASITPDIALKLIKENHNDFYEAIIGKGFMFHDEWIEVDENGRVQLHITPYTSANRISLDVDMVDETLDKDHPGIDVQIFETVEEEGQTIKLRDDLIKRFGSFDEAYAYIMDLEKQYDIRLLHEGEFQYYRTIMQNGDLVIHFFGDVGAYWNEEKIHLVVDDLTEVQKNAEIISAIQSNRVA